MAPVYKITTGIDPTTKKYGCVVSSKDPICGRYDFDTEACAKLWGEKQVQQCESIRLDPTDMKEFARYAEKISHKAKAVMK